MYISVQWGLSQLRRSMFEDMMEAPPFQLFLISLGNLKEATFKHGDILNMASPIF